MNILLTGSSGLIGSELVSHLGKNGHKVIRLVRRAPAAPGEISWNPAAQTLDPEAMEGVDAVIHLAGENLASGRWTAAKKQRIYESRVNGTRLLATALSRMFDPPKVLISISAVGIYGDRGEELLEEDCDAGTGFLPQLCQDWESATQAAFSRGIRVVIPRLGMVLSTKGGSLPMMLPVFRLGFGGRIGSGRQYISWIAIDDVVNFIDFALGNPSVNGIFNAVAPDSVTNREFSFILGQVLSRPAWCALPSFVAKIALGQMSSEVLLASARVIPARLAEAGFKFRFSDLEGALRHILGKPAE